MIRRLVLLLLLTSTIGKAVFLLLFLLLPIALLLCVWIPSLRRGIYTAAERCIVHTEGIHRVSVDLAHKVYRIAETFHAYIGKLLPSRPVLD